MNPTLALDILEASEIYIEWKEDEVIIDGRATLRQVEALVVVARERLPAKPVQQ